jgi:glycosyltransferase involved in cell wall biosynthesis
VKVSVCIPAYRQVDFLRQTLRSLVEQDFEDFELIVTDDSPDESVRTLLTEFDFGDRLKYVHNKPALGSPENWNAAVRMARGEYIKILHHDDQFIRSDALRTFVRLLDEHSHADFGFSGSRVDHVDSGLRRIHRADEQQLADLRADPAALFLGNCVGAPSATICRRQVGLEYDPRMKWLVDVDFYYRVLMRNKRFAFTAEPLISTPTNARHQVTQICRDDGAVELGEAMLLFEKLTLTQRDHPHVVRGWRHLFRRFGIRALKDFQRYGLAIPSDPYFEQLLRKPVRFRKPARHWRVRDLRVLALKAFYRVYPHVPAFIRRPLKRIASALGTLKK